ncbi:MAG: glycosyltransferase family 2 protein [bacterium]|nr:glycosyltransferase family 2 protein [bacterium]
MEWILISGYGLALLIISIFSLGQLNLTLHYFRSRKEEKNTDLDAKDLPFITIQLPVYNEYYVVDRLIDSVSAFDYPKELFEVQVLDDSDDETVERIASKVASLQSDGLQIEHIRRPERVGFKAGALKYGTEIAKGEFIAIFDADFLPKQEFLKDTIKFFDNPKVGMVQTRWGHINKDYSLITKMQAFGLDAHFTVEQKGRYVAGSFISFNGTAGVWRKECIKDAGGWQSDTLTEDLDLSYRAQLKGWQFKYMEDVVSPAELPIIMSAVKSQQYRWNKGAAETAKKNMGKVIKAELPFRKKLHAVMHLLNSSVFVFLLIAATLSIPMLYLKEANPELKLVFDLGSVFIIGFIAMAVFYWASSKRIEPGNTWKYYLVNFPLFLTFSMGLALHNAIAVLEGYFGMKSPFIRTPKFNVLKSGDSWGGNKYVMPKITIATILEGLLCIYFIFGIGSGVILGDFGLVLFHLMLALGFGGVFFLSVKPLQNA